MSKVPIYSHNKDKLYKQVMYRKERERLTNGQPDKHIDNYIDNQQTDKYIDKKTNDNI